MLTLAVKGLTVTMFSAPDSELMPNCAETYIVSLFTLFLRCYEERKYPNPVMSTRVACYFFEMATQQVPFPDVGPVMAAVMTMDGKVGHSEDTTHFREYPYTVSYIMMFIRSLYEI